MIDTRANSVDEIIPPDVIQRERRAIRDLARRADPKPEKVQWIRTDDISISNTPDGRRVRHQLTVSRLGPEYR